MSGKAIAAIVCVVGVLALWVTCLRMLLGYAQAGDFGAYIMVGGVFILLPFAVLVLIVALSRERSGYYDQAPAPSRALAPVPERPRLETSWSQPCLVARETTTVREIFEIEQPSTWADVYAAQGRHELVPAELRRIRPAIER